MMNKMLMMVLAIFSLLVLPLAAQCGGGGNGNGNGNRGGGGGNGSGNGSGSYNILNGTPFSFSGTVITADYYGSPLIVSTANGNMELRGLGSLGYWDSLNMSKPVVGDSVSGNGYAVDYNGTVRNILTDITVNGTLVPLRDSDGKPLWRGRGGNGGGGYGGGGGGYGDGVCTRCGDILNGTAFNYSGDIIDAARGKGLVIATNGANVELKGMGPYRYWENLEVTKPVVGDSITANGYTVVFDTNTLNILMSVTLADGTLVQLRDPETGIPLWRRGGRNK